MTAGLWGVWVEMKLQLFSFSSEMVNCQIRILTSLQQDRLADEVDPQ
jgi:hypothetical protein